MKFIIQDKKIIISAVLLSLFTPTIMALQQPNDLPFIGQKSFDFMGGSRTGHLISITKEGKTYIETGVTDSIVEYNGIFKNPIKLQDGSGYFFQGNNVYLLDDKGNIEKDCKEDGMECVSDLYTIEKTVISPEIAASNTNLAEQPANEFDPDSTEIKSKPWWAYWRSLIHSNNFECDMLALAPFSAAKQAGTTVENLPKNADLQLEAWYQQKPEGCFHSVVFQKALANQHGGWFDLPILIDYKLIFASQDLYRTLSGKR